MFRSSLFNAVLTLLFASGATALTIDDFADVGNVSTTLVAASVSQTMAGAGILGGERDVTVTRPALSGQTSVTFGGGTMTLNEAANGSLEIVYDGSGGSPGLGGLDFTFGGHSAFFLPLVTSSPAVSMVLTVTSGVNGASELTTVASTGGAGLTVDFADFIQTGVTAADFTGVDSLTLTFPQDGAATTLSFGGGLGEFRTVVPEPGTGLMLGLGLVALAARRRR